MHFESPYAFLLLLLMPAVLLLRYRKSGSIRFPSVGNAVKTGRSLRQKLTFVPALARMAALVLLTIALARPQIGLERIKDINKGIAIEMVVDRSGSMGAEMEYRGERMNRLEVVKRVFRDFVMGDGSDLGGRPNDLIGMIAFARYADTVCPLTLAHGALEPFLDSVKLVKRKSEDGTSIGDALASFAGVQRRMQHKGTAAEITVFDDYGHHPTEIRATLSAIKQAWPEKRLVVLFQPHRYSRTKGLFKEFQTCFHQADLLVMTDIYAASEEPIEGVSSESLMKEIQQHGQRYTAYVPDVQKLAEEVRQMLQPGDLVLSLGAGNIVKAGEDLLSILQQEKS